MLADAHGNVIHLGERDCTIQRRHQKLVEETPSPAVDDALRERIGAIAVDAARAVGYRARGTIEGLLSRDGEYFFLEMNTRIQVEHTVTEMVTGLDLVREQVLIAAGRAALRCARRTCSCTGTRSSAGSTRRTSRAASCPRRERSRATASRAGRACASTPVSSPGSEVSPLYDPMIAKLVVHGVDREHARRRMLRALDEFVIEGVRTLIGFHKALLTHPCFVEGETCHGLVESELLAARAGEFENGRPVGRRGSSARPPCVRQSARSRSMDAASRCACSAPEPAFAELRAAPSRTIARRAGRRRRARRRREPDAGHGARGRGRRGRRGRGGPGHLHRRGDEDGERGARAPRRHRRRACRSPQASRSRPAR